MTNRPKIATRRKTDSSGTSRRRRPSTLRRALRPRQSIAQNLLNHPTQPPRQFLPLSRATLRPPSNLTAIPPLRSRPPQIHEPRLAPPPRKPRPLPPRFPGLQLPAPQLPAPRPRRRPPSSIGSPSKASATIFAGLRQGPPRLTRRPRPARLPPPPPPPRLRRTPP